MVELGDLYEWKGEVWSWKNENESLVYMVTEISNSEEVHLMSVCDTNMSFIETKARLDNEKIYIKVA